MKDEKFWKTFVLVAYFKSQQNSSKMSRLFCNFNWWSQTQNWVLIILKLLRWKSREANKTRFCQNFVKTCFFTVIRSLTARKTNSLGFTLAFLKIHIHNNVLKKKVPVNPNAHLQASFFGSNKKHSQPWHDKTTWFYVLFTCKIYLKKIFWIIYNKYHQDRYFVMKAEVHTRYETLLVK